MKTSQHFISFALISDDAARCVHRWIRKLCSELIKQILKAGTIYYYQVHFNQNSNLSLCLELKGGKFKLKSQIKQQILHTQFSLSMHDWMITIIVVDYFHLDSHLQISTIGDDSFFLLQDEKENGASKEIITCAEAKRRVWDLITIGNKKFSLSLSSKSALHLHLMYIIIRERTFSVFFPLQNAKKISYKEVECGLCGG